MTKFNFVTFELREDGEFESVQELREALNKKDEIDGASGIKTRRRPRRVNWEEGRE